GKSKPTDSSKSSRKEKKRKKPPSEDATPTVEEDGTSPISSSVQKEYSPDDFDKYYMQKITSEFADDLDRVRSASDFNDKSLSILIEALKQGTSIYRDIPSFKLYESERLFAFLDIQPLSKGHALIIPKHHGAKLTDIPDDQLHEILPLAKKLVLATGAENYNILQNNGALAHQQVDHVHFHMIPKPNVDEGLGISWPAHTTDMDKLKALFNDVKAKM
ncbi:Adenosine 5'-monophosphoramidase, partial [Schaereria dolodes]|nr:Adenosine 5'-monophosphoramidase [Schaereria dolodes]